MIVAFAECLLLLTFLFVFFGVRLAGDPTPFLVATLLYAFCVASFGTMIGAAIPNQAAAMQAVMFGGFLLVFMLSGLMFPLANVPIGLRWISNFVWARYYIEIVRDVFLQGGGWPANWFKVLAIAGIGSVFFTLAWRRCGRCGSRSNAMNVLNRSDLSPPARADPEGAESDQTRSANHDVAHPAADPATHAVRVGDEPVGREHQPRHPRRQPVSGEPRSGRGAERKRQLHAEGRVSIRRRARPRDQPRRHRCGRRHPVRLRARTRPGTIVDHPGPAERDEREHGGHQPGLRSGRGAEFQRDRPAPVRPVDHPDSRRPRRVAVLRCFIRRCSTTPAASAPGSSSPDCSARCSS